MLRFAPPKQWDSDGRPTSAALSKHPGEDGLSTYVQGLLASQGIPVGAVVQGRPGYGVFRIRVVDAVNHACVVEHAPVRDTERPDIGFAHALVKPPDKPAWLEVRNALLASAEVLIEPTR